MTTSETERLRQQVEGTRRELSEDVNALGEKVSPGRVVGRRVDRARGGLTNLKDKIMGTAHSTTDSVGSTASSTADSVRETAGSAVDTVREAPQTVRRQTEGNPLAAGMIAFGAGWLISSLLPSTRKEQELAEQAKERLQPMAQQVATELKDNMREPAQHAVESVKSTASDAASTVTDESRVAAEHVKDRSTT